MDKDLIDILEETDEEVITPELDKRFNELSKEKQKEVLRIFSERASGEMRKLLASDTTEFPGITKALRTLVTETIDEVDGKRRGLWLL